MRHFKRSIWGWSVLFEQERTRRGSLTSNFTVEHILNLFFFFFLLLFTCVFVTPLQKQTSKFSLKSNRPCLETVNAIIADNLKLKRWFEFTKARFERLKLKVMTLGHLHRFFWMKETDLKMQKLSQINSHVTIIISLVCYNPTLLLEKFLVIIN